SVERIEDVDQRSSKYRPAKRVSLAVASVLELCRQLLLRITPVQRRLPVVISRKPSLSDVLSGAAEHLTFERFARCGFQLVAVDELWQRTGSLVSERLVGESEPYAEAERPKRERLSRPTEGRLERLIELGRDDLRLRRDRVVAREFPHDGREPMT